MSTAQGHVVALRYTPKAGGYAGVMTWTVFPSKAEFDAWLVSQDKQEVVEQGITEERAIEIAKQTPLKCYLMSAVEEGCNPETGEVYPEIMMDKIHQILMMNALKPIT